MQTCYNCGRQVEDNVLICPDCGALVKRYGRPIPQNPPSSAPQVEQSERPPAGNNRQDAYRRADAYGPAEAYPSAQGSGAIRVLADGRRKYSGFVCFWLVLCAIGAGYMAAGFGSMLLIYGNQALYLNTLSAFPELSYLLELVKAVLADVEAYHLIYVLRALFFTAKCAAFIWLLVSKKRLAFYAALICSALAAIMLIIGGGISGLIYALDIFITWLLLRGSWKLLR